MMKHCLGATFAALRMPQALRLGPVTMVVDHVSQCIAPDGATALNVVPRSAGTLQRRGVCRLRVRCRQRAAAATFAPRGGPSSGSVSAGTLNWVSGAPRAGWRPALRGARSAGGKWSREFASRLQRLRVAPRERCDAWRFARDGSRTEMCRVWGGVIRAVECDDGAPKGAGARDATQRLTLSDAAAFASPRVAQREAVMAPSADEVSSDTLRGAVRVALRAVKSLEEATDELVRQGVERGTCVDVSLSTSLQSMVLRSSVRCRAAHLACARGRAAILSNREPNRDNSAGLPRRRHQVACGDDKAIVFRARSATT